MKTKDAALNGRSQVFHLCRVYKGFVSYLYNTVYTHQLVVRRKYVSICFLFSAAAAAAAAAAAPSV